MIRIEKTWAWQNRYTFKIKPIIKLLRQEMNGGTWVDPFAGMHSPATITNDLNPKSKSQKHDDALDFLKTFETNSIDGVLYDPPYSLEQIKRTYEDIGIKPTADKYTSHQHDCKRQIARIVKPAGKVISFGWNSIGIGKKRGFKQERILLVCHGRLINDTIVTVEKKINGALF